MVYRFDEEWNGEVIAEATDSLPVSYLGFRFPASDIPAQVRKLFLLNRLRAIADVSAMPAPIVPTLAPLTGEALDLTYSVLRSPAPIHLEYLRNMGVQSSMTVSIIVPRQLWGIIACHHTTPRQVDASIRSVCDLIGQTLGSQVALRLDNAALQSRLKSRTLLHNYMEEMEGPETLAHSESSQSSRLLELFDADGVVLRSWWRPLVSRRLRERRVAASSHRQVARPRVAWYREFQHA